MIKSFEIQSPTGRHMPAHLIPATGESNHAVVFFHGYKGYKDWGPWNKAGQAFAKANLHYLAFNVSHNGGTVENPIDFPDLTAFSNNTYSMELSDVLAAVSYFKREAFRKLMHINIEHLTLIGHSRGGGMAVLAAAHSDKIDRLITWAAVSDYSTRFPDGEALQRWQEEGVYYVKNGRTGQQMPHKFSFYTDFQQNRAQLDIPTLSKKVQQPALIIHGEEDPVVDVQAAHDLAQWIPTSKKLIISDTAHTLGGSHPWDKQNLPPALEKAVVASIDFIKQ